MDYTYLLTMSLTLARSEREQNVLTHANLTFIKIYFCGVTVSNIRKKFTSWVTLKVNKKNYNKHALECEICYSLENLPTDCFVLS